MESSVEHDKVVADKLTEVISLLQNAAETSLQTETTRPESIYNQSKTGNPRTTNYNGCGNSDRRVEDSEEITHHETLKREQRKRNDQYHGTHRNAQRTLHRCEASDHYIASCPDSRFLFIECRRIDPIPNPAKVRRTQTGRKPGLQKR